MNELLVIFMPCWVALLCKTVAPFWHTYRTANEPTPFRFYVTDFWALVVGLTPTMMACNYAMKKLELGETWQFRVTVFVCVVTGISQVAGAFIIRIYTMRKPGSKYCGQFAEAMLILMGTLSGIAIPLLTLAFSALLAWVLQRLGAPHYTGALATPIILFIFLRKYMTLV